MFSTPTAGVPTLEQTFPEGERMRAAHKGESSALPSGKQNKGQQGPHTTRGFLMSMDSIKVEIN